jgi:hypothetical protein
VKLKHFGLSLCLVIYACGGSDSNAAVGKKFTYGAPSPAASSQTSAVSSQLQIAASNGELTSTNALALVDMSNTIDDLLGSSGVGVQAPRPSLRKAMTANASSPYAIDATCYTATANTITFSNCTETEDSFTFTINGSLTAAAGTVSWNFNFVFSVSSGNTTVNGSFNYSGDITVTANSIKGSMLADISASGIGLSEALVIDLGYTSNPFCVNSGSVEAKRVWTNRPNGVSPQEFPDGAVKITWTGCDQATVAIGTD